MSSEIGKLSGPFVSLNIDLVTVVPPLTNVGEGHVLVPHRLNQRVDADSAWIVWSARRVSDRVRCPAHRGCSGVQVVEEWGARVILKF